VPSDNKENQEVPELKTEDKDEPKSDSSKAEDQLAYSASEINEAGLVDEQDLEIMNVAESLENISLGSVDSDSDDGEWITPQNLKQVQAQTQFGSANAVATQQNAPKVACMTNDFAMQVILHLRRMYSYK
jgi:rRNA maturation endonuclease Nob1